MLHFGYLDEKRILLNSDFEKIARSIEYEFLSNQMVDKTWELSFCHNYPEEIML